jgi:hypothetical protein
MVSTDTPAPSPFYLAPIGSAARTLDSGAEILLCRRIRIATRGLASWAPSTAAGVKAGRKSGGVVRSCPGFAGGWDRAQDDHVSTSKPCGPRCPRIACARCSPGDGPRPRSMSTRSTLTRPLWPARVAPAWTADALGRIGRPCVGSGPSSRGRRPPGPRRDLQVVGTTRFQPTGGLDGCWR